MHWLSSFCIKIQSWFCPPWVTYLNSATCKKLANNLTQDLPSKPNLFYLQFNHKSKEWEFWGYPRAVNLNLVTLHDQDLSYQFKLQNLIVVHILTFLLRTCNVYQLSNLKDTLIDCCVVKILMIPGLVMRVRTVPACTFNLKVSYNLIFESNICQARKVLCTTPNFGI